MRIIEKEHTLNLSYEELQSKTICFLRFPLIVGVILIHSNFSNLVIEGVKCVNTAEFPVFSSVSYLFSQIISRIAVPLFFFISGFLFFYKTNDFNKTIYLQKLKKRVHSLLNIFWNLIILISYLFMQIFIPALLSGKYKPVYDYDITDWLWAFWDISMVDKAWGGGCPPNYPLWFIRDLMVIVCFSPFIYLLVKKLRLYMVLGLGACWMFDYWFDITGSNAGAFFFFAAGAYFSIHKMNFVEIMRPFFLISVFLYVLIVVINLCFFKEAWVSYVHNTGILIGIIAVITLSAHFISMGVWRMNKFLSDSSFFIYVYHGIPLAIFIKFLFKFLHPQTESSLLAFYLIGPVTIILIGLLLYYLLRKYLPAFIAIITGGR